MTLIFRTYSIFEIKGAGSSLGTDAYYKTIGYAGLFIAQTGKLNQFTTEHVTLTFRCMRYPRNSVLRSTI